MAKNSEARKRQEGSEQDLCSSHLKELMWFKKYYLAAERLFFLGETVGVTQEQWDQAEYNFEEALNKCKEYEKTNNKSE